MRITKSQLQEIIREEINTLSEDEQLDEFFGPFSAKAKRKKRRADIDRRAKEHEAYMDVNTGAYWDTPEGKADSAEVAKEMEAERAGRKAKKADREEANKRANKRATDKRFKGMMSGDDPDSAYTKEKIAKKGVGGVARGGMRSSNYNRKDESQLRERIKEEVTKVLKAHLKK